MRIRQKNRRERREKTKDMGATKRELFLQGQTPTFFFLIYIPPLRNSHTFNLQKKLIPKCCKGVGEKWQSQVTDYLFLAYIFKACSYSVHSFSKFTFQPAVYFFIPKELEELSLWNWSVTTNYYIQFSFSPMIYLFKQTNNNKTSVNFPVLSEDGLLNVIQSNRQYTHLYVQSQAESLACSKFFLINI